MVPRKIIEKIVNQKVGQDQVVKNLPEVIPLSLKVLKDLILFIREVIKVLINMIRRKIMLKKIVIVKIKIKFPQVKI